MSSASKPDISVDTFAKGYKAKLKNRRIFVFPSEDKREWFIRFRILADRKRREIRNTELILSDEAFSVLVSFYLKLQRIC